MRPAVPPDRIVAVVIVNEYWKKTKGKLALGVPIKKNSPRPAKPLLGDPKASPYPTAQNAIATMDESTKFLNKMLPKDASPQPLLQAWQTQLA